MAGMRMTFAALVTISETARAAIVAACLLIIVGAWAFAHTWAMRERHDLRERQRRRG